MELDKGIIDSVFEVFLKSSTLTEIRTETKRMMLRHSFEFLYEDEDGYPVLTLYKNRVMQAKLNLSGVPVSQVCEWVQVNLSIFN